MQDNKTNRDKLYAFLTNKGVTGIGADREEFETIFEDEGKQKKLYDFCVNKGYTGIGKNYDEFAGGFSIQKGANGAVATILEQASGVPYPAPEVDKSQYTFTAEQLGLEDHAESPENPVKSPEGDEYGYTGIGKDYKIEPTMKEQFGKEGLLNQSAEEYMTDVQKNIDSRKVGMDFDKLRQEQGINAGRSNVVKKEGRYYTEAGSFDNYSQAAYEADKQDLESNIKSMIDLYKNREGKEWRDYYDRRTIGLAGRGQKFETPEGLIAADKLMGLLSMPEEESKKILGEEGYNALKFFANQMEGFSEIDRKAWEDANRLNEVGTVAQGFEGIGRGMQYVSGETLNVFTGSALDDKEILENWDHYTKLRENTDPYATASEGEIEKLSYINELVSEYGSLEGAKEEIRRRSKKVSWGDRQMMNAAEAINNFKPTANGFGGFVAEMFPNMAGTLLAVGATALTKNPTIGRIIGGLNMAGLSLSTAGNSMKEAREYGANNGQVWAKGVADGLIEFITEKIPFDKATRGLFRVGKKRAGDELIHAVENNPATRKELENLLVRANKELNGRLLNGENVKKFMSNMVAEGLSEAAAEGLQTVTEFIYKDPKDYPGIMEIIDNALEGAKGGIFMGAVMGGAALSAERRMNNARRQKQGFVDVAQVEIKGVPYIGEILGQKKNGEYVMLINNEEKTVKKEDIKEERRFSYEQFRNAELGNIVNSAYEEGYSQEPTGVNAMSAVVEYNQARMDVARALGLAEDADIDAILNGRSAEEVALGDADVENTIVNYQMQKARKEGLQERFQKTRAKQYEESDRAIDKIANNGVVYSTTINGEQVYITGGTVVLDEQGFIDVNSSNNLFCLMPDGTKKPKSENELREKISMQNAEELKTAKRAEINDRWRAEFDTAEAQAIEQEKREAGTVFDKADSMGVHRIEILNEGEQMSDILIDGKQEQIPTEELNSWKQEAGIQSTDAVADDATDNVAPTESEDQSAVPTAEEIADAQAFAEAYSLNTVEAYQAYLDRFQEGAYRDGARNGIWALEGTGVADVASITNARDVLERAATNEVQPEVAPATGDNVAPVAPEELPDVPDFFRLNGKNYEVASRNADGSVDVMIDGKRETLPAGTDYSTSMPTDKKGEVQYEQMPVERTHEHFVQKVTDDESRALMIEGRRKKAEAERKKFDKKPDPGLDPDKWAEVNRKWEEGKKAAQAKVDYWNEVAKREAEITRSETREAVENIKPDVVKETAEEFIAAHLPKITPESFKRETGLSNEEQSKLVGVISNEGVTIEQAAESIMENYDSELKALGFTGDMQDVRNVIIDVLSQGNPRSYAKNSREARETENIEQQRAEAEAWAMGTFNMTLEELYVYEETLLPHLTREFEGFDEKEYYDNLAENYENDTTRESESIGRGGEVLQGEQSVPASGAPAVGERNEGGAVSNDVQGGGQNGVAQEAVNEPVGNSDQLSSLEIPNNQSVAEGDAPGQSGVRNVRDWLTPENLDWAENKTLKEIIEKFGNALEPIARIPEKVMRLLGIKDGYIYSGKGYFIDHAVNHHPEVTLEEYDNIQSIISDYDDIKDLSTDKVKKVAFIKKLDKGYAVVAEISEENGKVLLHKTFFYKDSNSNRIPYKNKPSLLKESPADGSTTISPEDNNQQPADTENISALDASSAAKIVENFENPTVESKNLIRSGSGPLTDREVVMESDIYSKVLGKPRYYGQKQRNYVARQRAKMAQKATELAEKLNTSIEVRETAEGLTGKKAKAKGWYDVKSGNIVVVVSNHGSIEDIQATVLHEVVAHKGLRQMFGEHFDTFLDNVYNNVDAEIRAEIDALTEKYGNTREATEEYLASLAENTYFEKVNPSLWSRIKQWFLNMLTEAGIKLDFELSDNELRYILWRSHQRLVNPGIYNPVTRITDVAVRARLGIGEYAPAIEEMSHAAEEDAAEYANKNQDIFVSNAQRAVEGIQQNKATAEQWIAMLKKNGGLKAGEDAWLGLEEWLNEKQGAVTKQEILDFIGENKIQIEEVEYAGGGEQMENYRGLLEKSKGKAFTDRFLRAFDIEYDEFGIFDEQEAIDLYNEANGTDMQLDKDGYWNDGDDMQTIIDWAESVLKDARGDVREIHRTRIQYTTEGLENKREIALVVPTVESYNIGDYTHFGDAGNGRAVAWVRFGETTDSEGNRVLVIDEIQSKRHQDGRERGYADSRVLKIEERIAEINNTMYGENGISQEMYEERERLQKELTDIVENSNSELKSVAEMLDEKQKHLKELRYEDLHKGIDERVEIGRLRALQDEVKRIDEYDNLENEIKALEQSLDNRQEEIKRLVTEVAEYNYRYSDLFGKTQIKLGKGVPSAPFEKNWHELAMKRMLRLAAEEGFDKVAWTTGEQQAERYNIGSVVEYIDVSPYKAPGSQTAEWTDVRINAGVSSIDLRVDVDGNVVSGGNRTTNMAGEKLADVVGKELADKILSTKEDTILDGDNLRIGGEGMKGFYDKMLPSFVQKYTKKWGAKVGEVTMPSLEENNTMWSVDVTPEMQESVMEGQTMFRITPEMDAVEDGNISYDEAVHEAKIFEETHKGSAPIIVLDGIDNWESEFIKAGVKKDEIERFRERLKTSSGNPKAVYLDDADLIFIFRPKAARKEFNGYIWHENMHKAIREDDRFNRDIAERIINTVVPGGYQEVIEYLNKHGYEGLAADEEALCQILQSFYINGSVGRKGLKGKGVIQDYFNPLIDKVYGRREGRNSNLGNRSVQSATHGTDETEYDGRALATPVEQRTGRESETEAQATGGAEETRFSIREEGIDNVPTQPLTLMERITNSLLEVSAKNKENLGLRADALKAFGKDINRVLSAMKVQREYDKFTVDTLVKLAKMYFKNAQLLGEVTPYEVARIMGVLNRSVGKRDVSSEATKLMDILLDAHTNALAGILEKAEKVKAKKVNAAGVEVMGRLDKYGQISVDEYRTGKEMTSEKLEEAIFDSDNRLAELEQRVREALGLSEGDVDQAARDYTGDNDVVNVYLDERARLEGLMLARDYKESVQHNLDEIKDLKQELKKADQDYRLGNINSDSLKEFRKSASEAILQSKAELIEGYHDLIYKFQEGVKKSSQRANAFVQAQIDRAREIQHNANSDMEGIEADSQGKHPERFNNSVTRTLMSPMPTFQGMLKKFGEKNVEGKGYLYERFMPQATKASDNEFRGKVAARVMIETKLKEIYGGDMNLGKFMKSLREPGITVTYREGNKMKEFELTQGQMLYIYMVNKMSDGQMKLRRMGITDDVVAELMTKLPEDTIRFADWVQNELLKDLRGKYNAVHERVFGAPMAAIENYFPIKIRKEARGEKGDVSEIGQEGKPSTITGSIIKRTKNAIAIDLSADAMQVLMEHIDDMEHWAAFAEFNRDINTLLNYRHFQNQVKNMTSLRYGSGEEMWKNFQKTAKIVSGTYKSSDVDKAVLNIVKGLTRAKINFRGYTAVKQLLSAPAFWTDAGVKELSYCYVNPKGCWKWAKENLPGFAERWQGRTMGNEKLLKSDSDWEVWRNEFVEAATRWGMTPNAAIDALTVAQGARAVYMTKLKQFKKAGYTEQRANEKALQAAAEAYNESQQSSEGMYLSPLQVEGTALAAVFTTFKNSNFGYSRKVAQSVANVRRKMRNDYKEEAIAFMTKQMVRDGLSEDNAKKLAEKVYKKSWYKDIANVAMFGFALPALWTWGGYAIYMILGDDDEEKEKMKEEIALRGALGFLDGIPLGESVISAINAVKEGDAKYFRLPELIAVGDIRNLAQVLNGDAVRGANDVINIVTAMGIGVSPQILTDFLVAISEIKDFSLEEFGMFTARVMSAPQSNLDALMVDDAMENSAYNLADIAERYIQFKTKRNAPITQFFYSDETEQKVIERYAGRFASMLEDNFENVVDDNNAYDLFYDSASPEVKEVLASYRKKFLAGDKADDFQKKSIKRLVLDLLESKSTEYSVYWNMTNPEDEETAFLIESELNRLEPIKKGEKDADNLSEYKELFKKELNLYKKLDKALRDVNKYKRKMQKSPDTRERGMTKIREERAEAIELINNYRNNE